MNLQNHLGQRAEQRLALMPHMLQSIEILQLSTLDLCARIEAEVAVNEVLEAVRPDGVLGVDTGSANAVSGEEARASVEEQFDSDRFLEPAGGTTGTPAGADARAAERTEAYSAVMHNQPAPGQTLEAFLRDQLGWMELDAGLRDRVELALASLDERGLLSVSDAEMAVMLDGEEWVAPVRSVLRVLEPRGVGARDAVECLLWQLDPADPDLEVLERMLRDHLEAVARNRLPEVARALRIDLDELVGLVERVRSLRPHPASAFESGDRSGGGATRDLAALRADLVVVRDLEQGADAFRVLVDDVDLPIISLNADYVGIAAVTEDTPTRDYLKAKIRSARDLIRAVGQRKETLAKVGAAIMASQRAFLLQGRRGMRPLRMDVIAAQLELHPSTVSRAIAGKFVTTEHGVFALREFFDGDRLGASSGADGGKGRVAISDEIRQLIADEDESAPLADEEIVDLLGGRGVEIARRTVAKYRKALGLGSSWQRKRHGS